MRIFKSIKYSINSPLSLEIRQSGSKNRFSIIIFIKISFVFDLRDTERDFSNTVQQVSFLGEISIGQFTGKRYAQTISRPNSQALIRSLEEKTGLGLQV